MQPAKEHTTAQTPKIQITCGDEKIYQDRENLMRACVWQNSDDVLTVLTRIVNLHNLRQAG